MAGSSYESRIFKDGETIFDEGDRAGEAYLIKAGEVRLEKIENGATLEIDTIGRGQIFGEMGVISDMNRMASAVAVGDTVLNCCNRKEMARRVEQLDKDRRDALRFLIVYCQEFMPYELMSDRPDNDETFEMDKLAVRLIGVSKKSASTEDAEDFLTGLYKVLIGYAERRVPPDLLSGEPEKPQTSMSLDEQIKSLDEAPAATGEKQKNAQKSSEPFSRKTVGANTVIFEEGESASCAYLLKSGKVDITQSKGGKTIHLTTILPNQIFGELALLDDSPRSATAIATEPSELVFVKPEDIARRMAGMDEFTKYWITYLTERVRDLSNRVQK